MAIHVGNRYRVVGIKSALTYNGSRITSTPEHWIGGTVLVVSRDREDKDWYIVKGIARPTGSSWLSFSDRMHRTELRPIASGNYGNDDDA